MGAPYPTKSLDVAPVLSKEDARIEDLLERARLLAQDYHDLWTALPDKYWAYAADTHLRCWRYALARALGDIPKGPAPKSDFYKAEPVETARSEFF